MDRAIVLALALIPPLASVACGAASPNPVTTAPIAGFTPVLSASAAPADAAPSLPPDVKDVVAIPEPASPCAIHIHYWSGAINLRVAAEGAAFAGVSHAHDVDLTLIEPSSAFVQAFVGSAFVSGHASLGQLDLHPHRAVVLAGVFVPDDDAHLGITAVRGDRVAVRMAVPTGVELLGAGATPAAAAPPLTGEAACADFSRSSIGSGGFDVSKAWGGAAAVREASFVPKRKVGLSVNPGDPPILRVSVDDALAKRKVTVIEQRAGRTRVHWDTSDGSFFGWVSSADLRPLPVRRMSARAKAFEEAAAFGMIGLIGADAESAPRAAPPASGRRLVCHAPVRVLSEIDGRRYGVGQIAPDAPFVVAGLTEGAVIGLVAPPSLAPATGTRWLVAARDLAACTPSTAEEVADEDPNAWHEGVFGDLGSADGAITGGGMLGAGGLDLSRIGPGARPANGTPSPAVPRGATPRVREDAITVNGRLPPEVVRRIVHPNLGRFRLCYEHGLMANPNLRGRVVVRFDIARDGSVGSVAKDPSSTLPDLNVVACISRGFGNLSFPPPEAGVVSVIYPIELVTEK